MPSKTSRWWLMGAEMREKRRVGKNPFPLTNKGRVTARKRQHFTFDPDCQLAVEIWSKTQMEMLTRWLSAES